MCPLVPAAASAVSSPALLGAKDHRDPIRDYQRAQSTMQFYNYPGESGVHKKHYTGTSLFNGLYLSKRLLRVPNVPGLGQLSAFTHCRDGVRSAEQLPAPPLSGPVAHVQSALRVHDPSPTCDLAAEEACLSRR